MDEEEFDNIFECLTDEEHSIINSHPKTEVLIQIKKTIEEDMEQTSKDLEMDD